MKAIISSNNNNKKLLAGLQCKLSPTTCFHYQRNNLHALLSYTRTKKFSERHLKNSGHQLFVYISEFWEIRHTQTHGAA